MLLNFVAIIITLALSRQPITKERDNGFEACHLPCWAGVTPSITHPLYAVSTLERNLPPHAIIRPQPTNGYTVILDTLRGFLTYDMRTITEIRLYEALDLYEIVTWLGAPDCVTPIFSLRQSRLNGLRWHWQYAKQTVSMGVMGDPLQALQNAKTATTDLVVTASRVCDTPNSLDWQGIAPLWHYARQQAG